MSKKLKLGLCISIALITFCFGNALLFAGSNPGLAHPEAMVDAKWLKNHYQDQDVLVLDASDPKDDTYMEKSLKGAIFMPYRAFRQGSGLMKGITYGMERETFDESILENMFRKVGVNNDSTVVLIAQYRVDDAAMVFWALKWLGHEDVKLLPVNYLSVLPSDLITSSFSKCQELNKNGNFEAEPNWSWYATRDDLLEAMHSPSIALWDVRSPAYFNGEKTKTVRGGTLATAVNWPFKKAWTDKNMSAIDWELVQQNLGKMFTCTDKDKDALQVITFCNSGHAAGAGYLAWQCGYSWKSCDASLNILAYDGSLPMKNLNLFVKP